MPAPGYPRPTPELDTPRYEPKYTSYWIERNRADEATAERDEARTWAGRMYRRAKKWRLIAFKAAMEKRKLRDRVEKVERERAKALALCVELEQQNAELERKYRIAGKGRASWRESAERFWG